MNATHIKNTRSSTFVGAMIFAQRKAAPNKLKHAKGNNKHIPRESWLKSMNINNEINDDNITNIKVHEGAEAEAEAKAKEYFEISIMKSTNKNDSNHMCQYDMPFKERLKEQTKESYRNCYILPSVSTLILIVLIKTLMDFMAFDFNEDEDMYRKKVYDDVSHYVDKVEHTEINISKNATLTDNKCLDSKNNHSKTNLMKIIDQPRCAINQISSKCMAESSLNSTEQTITTNEGVLEYGKLPLRNVICLKLFEIIF